MKDHTLWGESVIEKPVMRPVTVRQPMSTGHTAYHHLGGGEEQEWAGVYVRPVGADVPTPSTNSIWALASVAAVGLAAYHGYKRNHSVGWAVGWGIAAGISPIITGAVALAQGFGKRKGSR